MRSTVWLRYPWLGFAAALGAIALFGAKLLGFVLALQAYPPLPTPMELRDVASTEPGLGAWTEITDTTLRCDSLIHAGKSNYFASLSDPKGATAHVLAEFSRPEDCRRAVASGKLIGVRLVEPLERIRPLAPGMAWADWPTRVVARCLALLSGHADHDARGGLLLAARPSDVAGLIAATSTWLDAHRSRTPVGSRSDTRPRRSRVSTGTAGRWVGRSADVMT